MENSLEIQKILEENVKMKRELSTFFTGNLPENPTFTEIVLAQWGRKRLKEMQE